MIQAFQLVHHGLELGRVHDEEEDDVLEGLFFLVGEAAVERPRHAVFLGDLALQRRLVGQRHLAGHLQPFRHDHLEIFGFLGHQ